MRILSLTMPRVLLATIITVPDLERVKAVAFAMTARSAMCVTVRAASTATVCIAIEAAAPPARERDFMTMARMYPNVWCAEAMAAVIFATVLSTEIARSARAAESVTTANKRFLLLEADC